MSLVQVQDATEAYIEWLARHLPTATFEQACGIYQGVMADPNLNNEVLRWLDANDRFWLLTMTLRRRDAIHPWIYDRCREVQAAPDGYLDLWGRGMYKSSLITFAGTIQEVIRNPEITIGIFSHTRPIAKGFLYQIQQELETNDYLRAVHPDIFWAEPRKQAPTWSLDHGLVVKRKSNPPERTWEAWGLVDGQPTARHFGLLVYDDVVTEESVSTADMIAKTTQRWELSLNLGRAEITGRCGPGT